MSRLDNLLTLSKIKRFEWNASMVERDQATGAEYYRRAELNEVPCCYSVYAVSEDDLSTWIVDVDDAATAHAFTKGLNSALKGHV